MIVGFVDIGSNAARVLVADLGSGRSWRPVAMAREGLRLGESGEDAAGEADADRLVSVTRGFVDLSVEHGAVEVVAVATAALREAPDREALLARLRQETGLSVELLDGEEEARLAYLGLTAAVDLRGRRALCLDLGGGSTEVAAGEGERLLLAASLPLGAVRLTRELRPGDAEGRVSAVAWAALCERAAEAIVPLAPDVRRLGALEGYGVAGTVRSLVGLSRLGEDAGQRPMGTGGELDLPTAERLAARLRLMTLSERIGVAGLFPDRADVIVAGAAILIILMRELGLGGVRFVSTGLREGMVMRFLESQARTGGAGAR